MSVISLGMVTNNNQMSKSDPGLGEAIWRHGIIEVRKINGENEMKSSGERPRWLLPRYEKLG